MGSPSFWLEWVSGPEWWAFIIAVYHIAPDHRTSETLTEPRETITYLDHSHVAPTELHGRKLFLEDFNKTLRDEVDLEELSDQLVTVVQETMQPEFVSL